MLFSELATMPKLTDEGIQLLEDTAERNKTKIQQAWDARQKLLVDKNLLVIKHVLDLENRRMIENVRAIEKSRARQEKIDYRLEEAENIEHYRKLNLINKFKVRDREKKENIKKSAHIKKKQRRQKQIEKFLKLYQSQKSRIETNKALIDKCIGNLVDEYDNISLDENQDEPVEEIEEKVISESNSSSRNCSYMKVSKFFTI